MTDAPAPAPRRRREPAFNIPAVVVGCCVVLLGIHAVRLALSNETDNALVAALAFIPARVTYALFPNSVALVDSYGAAVAHNPILAQQISFLMGDGHARAWTLLSYALLHASWAHVGFNCIWLVAFGSAVARRFSAVAFLLLLCTSAVAGAVLQWVANYASFQLVIGASGAVSGAMGAAVRFVFRPPGDDPRPSVFGRGAGDDTFRQPALSLRDTLSNRTALLFVGVWFASDLLFGLFPALSGISDAPVAWQAHIGGFLVGLLAFSWFDARARRGGPARAGTVDGHAPPPPD